MTEFVAGDELSDKIAKSELGHLEEETARAYVLFAAVPSGILSPFTACVPPRLEAGEPASHCRWYDVEGD